MLPENNSDDDIQDALRAIAPEMRENMTRWKQAMQHGDKDALGACLAREEEIIEVVARHLKPS